MLVIYQVIITNERFSVLIHCIKTFLLIT